MRQLILSIVTMFVLSSSPLIAGTITDTFGTGANQFTIDFVTITGDASSANGTNISGGLPSDSWYRTFTEPGCEYRMGKYEITNEQWNKFISINGPLMGNPMSAYDFDADTIGANMPTNRVSWYEVAQFVNWLNISANHQPAYKFTGTIGMDDYTYVPWNVSDSGYDPSNPFRNSKAFYFLPNENEWVKAAYWNGSFLQAYATKPGDTLHQGDGLSGTGWNYNDGNTGPEGPWNVGSGIEELNGTYDMMGNMWEWLESPWSKDNFFADATRGNRGGAYGSSAPYLNMSGRYPYDPGHEHYPLGFRVASVPEPATLLILALGGLILRRTR